jgi:hypothetical protein
VRPDTATVYDHGEATMMYLINVFSTWLNKIGLQSWVDGSRWIVPSCQAIHFLGLALLMGGIGLLDLRMLGIGKGLPISQLNRLVPLAVMGFGINLVTGTLLYAGDPSMFGHNVAFGYKMLFIVLAGINVLMFYVTGAARAVESLGPNDDAPISARIIGGMSLFLWVGVMFWGRMLPFIGNAF